MTEHTTSVDQGLPGPRAAARDLEPAIVAFARACRSSARAVGLYPPEHPAVKAALDSVVEAARAATSSGPLRVDVMPNALSIEGQPLSTTDSALSDLAVLLHSHYVAHLIVSEAPSTGTWRNFLSLLALPPSEVVVRGGMARVWSMEGASDISVIEIDYSAVLRERLHGDRATWEAIIYRGVVGSGVELDDASYELLFAIIDAPSRINDLADAVDRATDGKNVRNSVVLAHLLSSVAELVKRTEPERLDTVMSSMSEAVGQLRIDRLLPMLSLRREPEHRDLGKFMSGLAGRMRSETVVQVVARSIVEGEGASARLAQAFAALVPDFGSRDGVLNLAHQQLSGMPVAQNPGFDDLWSQTKDLLLQYSDEDWVADAYASDLTRLQGEAVDLELFNPDPPERVSAWLATVSDRAQRALDGVVLGDLVRLELGQPAWRTLVEMAMTWVDGMVQRGDFEAADKLVQSLVVRPDAGREEEWRMAAGEIRGRLSSGPVLAHIANQLDKADEPKVAAIRRFCSALGAGAIRPLAEVLSVEERPKARERLIGVMLAYGAAGRQAVERLRQSSNPLVRRTAVQLLREYGGQEVLPELQLLLDDAEPNVQRDATHAIALVGSDAAFGILVDALREGSDQARGVITATLWAIRDESAPPLLTYLVANIVPRGEMRPIYERAVMRLAALGGEQAVMPLKNALYKGEWWAPLRTAALRAAAAEALARVGTASATEALEEAVAAGSRGVRRAARTALVRSRAGGASDDQ